MITEELEFQISQYADGTLSDAERPVVDRALESLPQARSLLSKYQQLDSMLSEHKAGPVVHWDRLTEHLSSRLDRSMDRSPVIAGRINFIASTRLRIAAAFIVAGTAWLVVHRTARVKTPIAPAQTTVVSGPEADVATGPAVTDIQVGPSALAARNDPARYGQGMPAPSKVIIGLNPPSKPDSRLH